MLNPEMSQSMRNSSYICKVKKNMAQCNNWGEEGLSYTFYACTNDVRRLVPRTKLNPHNTIYSRACLCHKILHLALCDTTYFRVFWSLRIIFLAIVGLSILNFKKSMGTKNVHELICEICNGPIPPNISNKNRYYTVSTDYYILTVMTFQFPILFAL